MRLRLAAALRPYLILPGCLCLASVLVSCQTATGSAAKNPDRYLPLERVLSRFLDWFEGEYDNWEQVWQQQLDGVKKADRHEHVHHIFKAVSAPNIGEHVFFVKQYKDGDYENVYRQRLYKITIDKPENAVRLAVYRFKDEAEYRNADQNPALLTDITPEQLKNLPGCDVFWTYRDDHFVGEIKPNACFYYSDRLQKNIYITDTLKLTDSEIWIADRAYDAAGNKIFGRDEQHKNRKVMYFTGWAAIRSDKFDAAAEAPEKMILIDNLRLHNEGQRIALVTEDGIDTGYTIELSRLTYQKTGVKVLKLGLIQNTSGDTISYIWANADTRRLGMNLRWLQVGLTKEADI